MYYTSSLSHCSPPLLTTSQPGIMVENNTPSGNELVPSVNTQKNGISIRLLTLLEQWFSSQCKKGMSIGLLTFISTVLIYVVRSQYSELHCGSLRSFDGDRCSICQKVLAPSIARLHGRLRQRHMAAASIMPFAGTVVKNLLGRKRQSITGPPMTPRHRHKDPSIAAAIRWRIINSHEDLWVCHGRMLPYNIWAIWQVMEGVNS